MKKIKQILEYISTVDFLAVLVAIFSLCICITAYATMFHPEKFDQVYKILFASSVFSFTVSYLILKPIEYLFLSKLPVNLMWFFVIILGSFTFGCFYVGFVLEREIPWSDFSFYIGFILLALIPAAVFRFTMNFAISFWQERKEKPISIVN